MTKSIADALREYVDEQEHAGYIRRAQEIASLKLSQPLTQKVVAEIQSQLDAAHFVCSEAAGRRLRRIRAVIDMAKQPMLQLVIDAYQPAAHGNRGE